MGAKGSIQCRLGELVEIKHGWPFKSELFAEDLTGRPIVISVGNFRYTGGFRFGETVVKEYRGSYPKEFELAPNDILLVMTCQTEGGEILGIPARVPDDGRVYLHNQRLGKIVVRDKDRVDPNFLYWLFLSGDFNRELVTSASGTKILHTAPSRIEAFRFDLPPMDEQHAIAHILGTLNDKIELNRRMSETLEAMALALFKSWFVDFDPIRAKAEGRDPGLPQPLADLFPARLVDSKLGEIPERWEVAPLPDVIEVNPARPLRRGEVAPYLDMANMPTRGHSPDAVIERAFGSGMRFVNGDTLVARITPCLENGKTAYVDFLQDGQVGWGSTEYIVLHPKPPIPSEFAYCLARSNEFRDFAIQSMTGSSGRQRVPAESFAHYRVLSAPEPIVELFGTLIKPLFSRASAATTESRTLAALRGTLMPKLISGELRVMNAERSTRANT